MFRGDQWVVYSKKSRSRTSAVRGIESPSCVTIAAKIVSRPPTLDCVVLVPAFGTRPDCASEDREERAREVRQENVR